MTGVTAVIPTEKSYLSSTLIQRGRGGGGGGGAVCLLNAFTRKLHVM